MQGLEPSIASRLPKIVCFQPVSKIQTVRERKTSNTILRDSHKLKAEVGKATGNSFSILLIAYLLSVILLIFQVCKSAKNPNHMKNSRNPLTHLRKV